MKEIYGSSSDYIDITSAVRMLNEAFGIRLIEDDLRRHDHLTLGKEISRRVRSKLKQRRLAVMEREV